MEDTVHANVFYDVDTQKKNRKKQKKTEKKRKKQVIITVNIVCVLLVLLVSHSFGYGLMDAAAMVRLARVWNTVTPQQFCEIRAPDSNKYVIRIILGLSVGH